MGILRLYLALCVVATHANSTVLPWSMHNGIQAVEIFFIISGFYMALVGPSYASTAEFYASRFLRIYVPYYVTLLAIVAGCVLTGVLAGRWGALQAYADYSAQNNGLYGVVIAAASNVTLLFQDWVMFLRHDPGSTVQFTADFLGSHVPLYKYLLIPQSWSVGIELTFYLLVPLLCKVRTQILLALIVASIGLRVAGYEMAGLTRDPWTYRFFPFEIALFCLGMVVCRCYIRYKEPLTAVAGRLALDRGPRYFAFGIILLCFFYLALRSAWWLGQRVGSNYAHFLLNFIWAAFMPFCFAASKDMKLDRFLGELSYPVYLCHYSVVAAVVVIWKNNHLPETWVGVFSAIVSVALSSLAFIYIFSPVERRRHALAAALVAKWRQLVPQRTPLSTSAAS